MRLLPLLLGLLALPAPAPEQTPATVPVGPAWRDDLRLLARELPRRHPDLFHRMSRASWDSAVAALDRRLPRLSRNQALVSLMELVALPHDGHTSLNPMFDPAFRVHYYPVQFELFEDGLYVRAAAERYASVVGARVIRIGRASAEEAVAGVARTLPHENDWWVRAWAPWRLAIPEILDGLGLAADPDNLPLVVERAGKRDTVTLHPAAALEPHGHDPAGPIDRTGWVDMRTSAEVPLWLQHAGRPYWMEYRPRERLLYVSYRGVVSLPQPTNEEFWRGVFTLADSAPVDRLVLDLRDNGGGNAFYNRQVVRGLIARPALDRPDRLFVIIGGRTFSAAMNLVLDLEQWTSATFVGTPTGNATLFFGDHTPLLLPRNGLTVNISSLPWYPSDPRDTREFKAPVWYTPITSDDYRAGRDPALQTILDPARRPSIAEALGPALAAGDTALDAGLAQLRSLPLNRFRDLEGEVNAWGYRLLAGGNQEGAIAVFRLNTRAYPQSANTFDSLGEALAAAGRRNEAIAAYRHALSVNPGFQSSRAALERLGSAAR